MAVRIKLDRQTGAFAFSYNTCITARDGFELGE
jgi:hypothetical protein